MQIALEDIGRKELTGTARDIAFYKALKEAKIEKTEYIDPIQYAKEWRMSLPQTRAPLVGFIELFTNSEGGWRFVINGNH